MSHATEPTVIGDLAHEGVIAVRGADAAQFLQNQLTLDIRSLGPLQAGLAGYCTPKGRLLALFTVIAHPDERYLLCTPAPLAASLVARLRLYVLRMKVIVEEITASIGRTGCTGHAASTLLDAAGLTAPVTPWGLTWQADVGVLRLPAASQRFMVIHPVGFAVIPRHEMNTGDPQADVTRDDGSAFRREGIRAGIPVIHPATQEAFVPQMVNLDLVGGISFTKGCYPGQEIVARTKYLGRVKRRMFRARFRGPLPNPGDPVRVGGQEAPVGAVVEVAGTPGDGELLMMLQIEHAASDNLTTGANGGVVLLREPLPYPIPEESTGESA